MRIILISLFVFSSYISKAQDLAIEVLQVIYADSFNLNFIHEDTVFLPDGSGVSYESFITIDGFDTNATILASSDFSAIGMIMEHSYLGDLELALYCPNGQYFNLKTYPGGGATFLGEPIDDDNNLDPGIGYYYMFRDPASYSDMTTESDSVSTLLEGSYLWENSADALIGCPINGDWTIEIIDNLASDNGFIFNWQLFFDPAIVPDSLNNGSIILDIVGQGPPGATQTDWYVEWNNGTLGLVNENLAPGEYTAWLREDGTNAMLDSVHVFVGIGNVNTRIDEIKNTSISIYPNPVGSQLTLVWEKESATFLILNSKGQAVNQGKVNNGLNTINTQYLKTGLYIIQINTTEGVLVNRFIKN